MFVPIVLAIAAGLGPRLSVRVEGDGYLRFLQNGRVVYARQAELSAVDGRLSGGGGAWVSPTLHVAENASRLDVESDGRVYAVVSGARNPVGRLALALYPEASPKNRVGDFWAFQDRPTLAYPGEAGAGRIMAGSATAAPPVPVRTDPKPVLSGTATVTVRDDTTSDDGMVTLGQIATIEGDPALVATLGAIELAPTPPFRTRATVSRVGVEQKIRAAGLDPRRLTIAMGSFATIRRRSQTLPASRFVEEATKALSAQGAPLDGLTLEAQPAELEAPSGELRIETQVSSAGLVYGATVGVWHGSNRIGTRSLRFAPNPAAIGVRAGDLVRLVLKSAGANVSCPGKATSDALLGGEAVVRLDTGKTHRGKVIARGVVEVTL